MSTYFTIITDVGTAKIAAAMANSTSVTLTQMAVGDGNGLPVDVLPGRTELVNETFRAGINLLDQNAGDLSQFMAELLVPAASGGWTTREVGLFDSDGDLIAYSNFPDTYKPTIAEGATQDLIIQMHIKVDNYSVISVSIDPSLVQATRTWVLSVLNGITSITMNTSDVTLTEGQSDRSIIIITGALTGNRNLIFPNIEKQWTVINNTTGNFTITCKTAAGTGVIAATTDIIYCNGANIYSNVMGKVAQNDLGFYTDSGAANAYVLTPVSGNTNPTAYAVGMTVSAYITNANTGDSTINVAGLGVKDISSTYGSLTALRFGQMSGLSELVYDGSRFYLSKSGSGSAGTIGANLTVTVGAGGDYSTINDALEYLSKFKPLYISNGFAATVSLLTGFVMTEQVICKGVDLSWITITGTGGSYSLTRSALTTEVEHECYPAFAAIEGGKLPKLNAELVMDTSGTATNRYGIYVSGAGSSVNITASNGVSNAAGYSIYATNGAVVSAANCVASYSGHGIGANNGATVYADGATATNCGGVGIVAWRASTISATDADVSSCTTGVYSTDSSRVDFTSGRAVTCTNYGIYARNLGQISAAGAICSRDFGSPTATDIYVHLGGIINAFEAIGGSTPALRNTLFPEGIIFDQDA